MAVIGAPQESGRFTLIQVFHLRVVVIVGIKMQRHPRRGQAKFIFFVFPQDPPSRGLADIESVTFIAN